MYLVAFLNDNLYIVFSIIAFGSTDPTVYPNRCTFGLGRIFANPPQLFHLKLHAEISTSDHCMLLLKPMVNSSSTFQNLNQPNEMKIRLCIFFSANHSSSATVSLLAKQMAFFLIYKVEWQTFLDKHNIASEVLSTKSNCVTQRPHRFTYIKKSVDTKGGDFHKKRHSQIFGFLSPVTLNKITGLNRQSQTKRGQTALADTCSFRVTVRQFYYLTGVRFTDFCKEDPKSFDWVLGKSSNSQTGASEHTNSLSILKRFSSEILYQLNRRTNSQNIITFPGYSSTMCSTD